MSPAAHALHAADTTAGGTLRLPEWQYLLPAGPAVIALADTRSPLASMASRVADDGVLYWEIDRRVPGQVALTPARAFEQLAAHGLTPTAAYWVKPGFPERHMFLPMASADALRWYLETLYRTPTRTRRVLQRALRPIADHSLLDAVAPCYAITAVRGPARPPAILESAIAAEAWPGGDADTVLLAHGTAKWSRVALMLFDRGAAAPSTVLKLPRATVCNPQVEWEHDVLGQLNAVLSPPLRDAVPSSRVFQWGDLAVAAESAATGAALSTRTGLPDVDTLDDLRLCAYWLGTFHNQTVASHPPAREWLTRHLIDGLCQEYAGAFDLTPAEARLFGRLRRHLNTCPPTTLPLAWQHTDFGPWNVYRDGETLRVIDWEVARIGPVLVDLLYFITHWSAAVMRRSTEADRVEYFASLFCTRTAHDRVALAIREQIGGYIQRVGIHWSLFPAILAYTFVELALEHVRRGLTFGDAAPQRSSNPYVAYVAAIAEHADVLLPAGESDER